METRGDCSVVSEYVRVVVVVGVEGGSGSATGK